MFVGNMSLDSNELNASILNDLSHTSDGHKVICEQSNISNNSTITNAAPLSSEITRGSKPHNKALSWAKIVATNAETGDSYM